MNEGEILSILQHIVDDLSGEDVDLSMDSDLVADAGLDSIDLLDMMCRAGDCWGVELDLDSMEQLSSPTRVGDIVKYIGEQVGSIPLLQPPPTAAELR